MTTDKLKESSIGFGVFGYYTGNSLYQNSGTKDTKESTTGEAIAANFMYNQQVKWQKGATYVGYVNGNNETGEDAGAWTYSPIKYWPNDIAGASTAVDDQDNDKGNNSATGSDTYGGNVSFFAYAPYVDTSGITGEAQNSGIVAINKSTVAPASSENGKGNKKAGDPTITYKLAATTGNNVDLLWGTKGKTSSNVLGASQEKEYVWASDAVGKGPVNINLTKQKTNGVVDFTFKHALSKVGGSTHPGGTEGTNSGLMVVLDIDDMKGAETGGTKDATTLVTINSIEIKATAKTVDGSNKKPGDSGYTATYFQNDSAVLNLATGVWTLPSGSTTTKSDNAAQITHTISSSSTQATLNADIKEETPTWASNQWQVSSAEKKGVETTKKNVYATETSPLLFIPGTYPELEITVDYIVRTYDANLTTPTGESSPCSKIQQRITKKVTFEEAVELNKQYSLLMHLGLTSVKFTATVSNWSVEGDTDNEGVIDEGETVKVDDVYLPINVQDETTAQTVSAGSNTIVNTAAATTEYTITLTGLTASSTLTLNSETGSNIVLSDTDGTKVYQANGTTETTASDGKYTVVSGEESVVIKVILNANSDTSNAKANKLTITEKSGETVKSTTTITITQNKATS